jgi:hypothetical protein
LKIPPLVPRPLEVALPPLLTVTTRTLALSINVTKLVVANTPTWFAPLMLVSVPFVTLPNNVSILPRAAMTVILAHKIHVTPYLVANT